MRGCKVSRRVLVLVAGAGRDSEDDGKRIREINFSSYPYIGMEAYYE